MGWIGAKLALRERTGPLNPTRRMVHGETFRYLGRRYQLAWDDGTAQQARMVAGCLVLPADGAAAPERARQALVDWYCRTGERWLSGRLQPWAARLDVPEPHTDVRDLGGRWGTFRPGSPTAPARISLGWPVFQLPAPLIEYVIAHELAHVRVPGHSAAFWRLLGSAMPECAQRRAELDELGRRTWTGALSKTPAHGD